MTQNTQDNWINNFNERFVGKGGYLIHNHLELKDFIRDLLSSQLTSLIEEIEDMMFQIREHPKAEGSWQAHTALFDVRELIRSKMEKI